MYHYTECGLDNVWLENGYTEHHTPYGKGVSVAAADQLHNALAQAIAKKPGRITGAELRFLRSVLDLSQSALGATLGVTEQSISLWERKNAMPTASEAVVRMLVVENHDGNPRIRELLKTIAKMDNTDRFVAKASAAHEWTAKARKETAGVVGGARLSSRAGTSKSKAASV